jgi:ABC-type phosphate/phosphonate transport system ATPase subunit
MGNSAIYNITIIGLDGAGKSEILRKINPSTDRTFQNQI